MNMVSKQYYKHDLFSKHIASQSVRRIAGPLYQCKSMEYPSVGSKIVTLSYYMFPCWQGLLKF